METKPAEQLILPWAAAIPEGYEVSSVDESTCEMVVVPVSPGPTPENV